MSVSVCVCGVCVCGVCVCVPPPNSEGFSLWDTHLSARVYTSGLPQIGCLPSLSYNLGLGGGLLHQGGNRVDQQVRGIEQEAFCRKQVLVRNVERGGPNHS